MLFIVLPLAFVSFSVWPLAHPKTFYATVRPTAFINLSSRVVIGAFSAPSALLEHSFVFIAIAVDLNSRAMLHIIFPMSFVACSCFAMYVYSVAISLIISPFSLIIVSIGVSEFSLSLGFIIEPLSFIDCAIWPALPSVAISHVAEPLPFILDAILELDKRFLFPVDSIIKFLHLCIKVLSFRFICYLSVEVLVPFKLLINFQQIPIVLFLLLITVDFWIGADEFFLFDWRYFVLAVVVPKGLRHVIAQILAGSIAHVSKLIIIIGTQRDNKIQGESITICMASGGLLVDCWIYFLKL